MQSYFNFSGALPSEKSFFLPKKLNCKKKIFVCHHLTMPVKACSSPQILNGEIILCLSSIYWRLLFCAPIQICKINEKKGRFLHLKYMHGPDDFKIKILKSSGAWG